MGEVTRERISGVVEVAPGRRLSFVSFGPPDGRPLIWMHGTPGAATQVPEDVRARAERDGFRIIGLDRPGVGHSAPYLYDNVAAFVDDLGVVLDELGIETTSVVGLSGGGPYTLAAAAGLPERITSVGVLGGVAPTVGPDAASGGSVALARFASPVLQAGRLPLGYGLARLIRLATPVGSRALRMYARFSPEGDRELLHRAEFADVFIGDLTSRGRRQFSAALADVILFTRAWGFKLSEVQVPVHWWHGTDDNIVPFAHGEHMVERLGNATFHPVEGGGHLAGFGVGLDVLDQLLAT